MRTHICLLALIFSLLEGVKGQSLYPGQIDNQDVPVPRWHYTPEYLLDFPIDTAAWFRQLHKLMAAFGSTDERYLRREVPVTTGLSSVWEATGWKGERLNAQVLVWSPDSIAQVRVTVSDLVSEEGKIIKNESVDVRLVRYVLSNFPYNASHFSCDITSDSVWLMPDRLQNFEIFELPGESVRPLWLSINIPVNAKAGKYTGTIAIQSKSDKVDLRVIIKIQNMRLPEPSDWEFRLDLWQNPWVVSEYYDVMPWSEEHLLLLKKHLQLYADAGGKYITTYAVHSPWSDNSYSLEGSMITWIKNKDKTWTFDYSIFDKYVQLCMELGINKAITVYTPLPWGNRFYFFDEVTGNNEYAEWPPDSTVYKEVWFQFLDNLKKHLYKKGWLKITYLGINENPLENTQTVINLIKEHDTDWRITYAGNWHTELTGLLDDYSLVINSEPSQVEISQRKASGLTTTFYVCCTPDKPNNFVFSPPVESRFIGWYASAYGYDGFLRWAYDAWPSDPLRDARHTLWPAGDCFLIYPGGLSSIRFEKLREGIVDFEKIRILRQLAKKSKNKKAYLLLSELNGLMKDYIIERDNSRRNYDTPSLRNKLNSGQEIIIDLTNELE